MEWCALQVDFLDRSAPVAEALSNLAASSKEYITGKSAEGSNSTKGVLQATEEKKAIDASRDGRRGFVRYEPSMVLVGTGGIEYFSSVAAYATNAGVFGKNRCSVNVDS
jgi:hypothetical protein